MEDIQDVDLPIEVTVTELRPRFNGGYSDVYIGRFGDKIVAVKVIKHIRNTSEEAMQRKLRRERKLWSALDHPNIVPFYGYATNQEIFKPLGALISPWYQNGDAGQYLTLHGGRMDIPARSTMWSGVIAGVHYLHTYSPVIVHGDLKPGNILIDDQGNARLCDFGISRALTEAGTSGLTTTSAHTGTERYLSYELLEDTCVPTTASDVYALACTGLEFIYLQFPRANRVNNFRGQIFLDIHSKVPPAVRPDPLTELLIPLWHLFESCWAVEPASRPDVENAMESHKQWHAAYTRELTRCRELCSLVESNGNRLCSRRCIMDGRYEHRRHSCDRSGSCPVECQFASCSRSCAAGDHFHALKEGAVHLCEQEHACPHLCDLPGICEIATKPIESTLVGRRTKYIQEAHRIDCVILIDANKLEHDGPHVHSRDPDAFHFCDVKCRYCEYYCTLPFNHHQEEHDTSHGSMKHTEWAVEGDEEREYATGDPGAPMSCSMLCRTLGRHVHIDTCQPDADGNCAGVGVQHVKGRHSTQDLITHRLFWVRSGFKDPYTQIEQTDFDLCDHRCGGDEHDPDTNHGAIPSLCTLPLFHPPADQAMAPPLGHISHDGHSYTCKNPVLSQRSFHIFFVINKYVSAIWNDRRPLLDTQRIAQIADNRFGAILSSLYAFWTARDTVVRAGAAAEPRRDAYTVITFGSRASVTLANDMTSDPDQLLERIPSQSEHGGGWDFTYALETIQQQMESTWDSERSPVVILISDGGISQDGPVYDLSRAAVRLGKPLEFHAISFVWEYTSSSLRRMANIAREVYDNAPRDPLAPPGNPCSYHFAEDTAELVTHLVSLAESLKNP